MAATLEVNTIFFTVLHLRAASNTFLGNAVSSLGTCKRARLLDAFDARLDDVVFWVARVHDNDRRDVKHRHTTSCKLLLATGG